MPLTAAAIEGAKPRQKAYKLFDSGGLFLLVHPNGGRYWRLKYRIHRREKLLALGTFPDVTLAKARMRRDDARKLIADNADPGIAKQADKTAGADTFRVLAMEWLSKQSLARATLDKATWIFEQLLFPELSDRLIRVISAPDLLAVLRKIEERVLLKPRTVRSSARAKCSDMQSRLAAPRMIRLRTYAARSRQRTSTIARPLPSRNA